MQNVKFNLSKSLRSLHSHIVLFSLLSISIFIALFTSSVHDKSSESLFLISILISFVLVIFLLFIESAVRYCAYLLEDKNHFVQLKMFAQRYNLTYTHKIFSPDPRAATVHGTIDGTKIEAGHFVLLSYASIPSSYISFETPTKEADFTMHKKSLLTYSHILGLEHSIFLSEEFSRHFHTISNNPEKVKKILDENMLDSILALNKKFNLNKIEVKDDRIYIESGYLFDSIEWIEKILTFANSLSKQL